MSDHPSNGWERPKQAGREFRDQQYYLEGQGDLVSRLIMGRSRVTIWVLGVMNLLTKSPDPPSIIY